jgi:hypothetical protein
MCVQAIPPSGLILGRFLGAVRIENKNRENYQEDNSPSYRSVGKDFTFHFDPIN